MLRFVAWLSLCLGLASGSCSIGLNTDPNGPAKASDPENFHEACVGALRAQVRMEFEASLQYLLMGAHFAHDSVNLPGFSGLVPRRSNSRCSCL